MSNMSDLQAVTRSDMRCETSKDVTLSKLLAQIQNGEWSRDTDLEPYSRTKDELSIFEGVIRIESNCCSTVSTKTNSITSARDASGNCKDQKIS